VRLTIPAIGVDTPLLELGLHTDGTIEVPPVAGDAPAGWYRNLASPGEVGPAVVIGHVDSARDGPAVFFRLRDLRAGDRITVARADGRTVVFTVDRVAAFPKAAFPTAEVYGGVDHSALRLVTCGGEFDRYRREYKGNVIAFASLTSVA
jgi:sortase (surface protein transpeptidase)